nr:MAG TPA: hypothetical protein [Caudoviricetes sp.]
MSIKKSPHQPASKDVRMYCIGNNHSKGHFLIPILSKK